MEHRNLQPSHEAMVAIKGIVGDALASPHCIKPPMPRIGKLTRPELACGLKRIQHAELVHYLQCDASREVLLMIRQSIEVTLHLLDRQDEDVLAVMHMVEPYRHHLYARVTVAALLAAEREAIKQECDYWKRRNAMQPSQ